MIEKVDLSCVTGGIGPYWPAIRYQDDAGGSLDAPKFIAAGYMSDMSEVIGEAVSRGRWS
jgi:hypothetical protein